MKKKVCTIILVICIIWIVVVNYYFLWLKPINFKNVSYKLVNNKINATLTFSNNVNNGSCIVLDREYKLSNHECLIEVPNEKVSVIAKTNWNEITIDLDPKQDQVLDFELLEDKIYMIIGEEKEINITVDKFGEPDVTSILVSDDENIVKTNGNVIEAIGNGTTNVHVSVGNITKDIVVVSTNLVGKPGLTKYKEFLPCNIYSEEDNKILDEFLEYRINEAGYKTRGAVVAAARFLTLEFPYRIDYFWENGRLDNTTGGPSADGEGR